MAENFFGHTDMGRMRDNNEDTFFAEKLENGAIAACVIDGVGGYEGGEVAAEIARETLLDYLRKNSTQPIAVMRNAVAEANQKIYAERLQNKQRESMACVLTVALADINNNEFHYAHVGDTRLYLFRDHSLVKLTKDHSFVGFLEDSRRLTEDAAMNHPKRHEINKALGFDPNMAKQEDYIETGQSPFLPGDLLLLCSDGLTDLVNSDTIKSILSSPASLEQKCKSLIDAANEAGGKDNITVVVVHNDKKPAKLKATKPVLVKKKDEIREQEAVIEKKEDSPVPVTKNKGRSTTLLLLLFLCIASLAANVLLWLNREKKPVVANVQRTRNAEEQKFADFILAAGDSTVVTDSVVRSPVLITDTITITKGDTLRIIGNGLVLRADTAYRGPGIVVLPGTPYVMLENFVFENFDVGIQAPASALQLKNVRFVNCGVSWAAQVMARDTLVNGTMKLDSLRK